VVTVQKHRSTLIRRKQIIDAARKLIIRQGSENITIKDIAEVVGITEGAIYRHFKSKEDILFFLIECIEEDLIGDIIEASTNGHTSIDVLESIFRSHVSAIEQRRGVSFLIIAEIVSLGDKKLNRRMSETITGYINRIGGLLAKGVKWGELRRELDLESTAILFFGMVQGLVNIWALGGHEFKLEDKYRSVWNSFREAIIRR
jgi:TetR/AcrR family fatty acid metabolism transcriptional regulator